ncbi:MAG: S1/P1 nuclease [Colwellia sp.]|nr:S1/P1 nuclease [Colwellia sp.]
MFKICLVILLLITSNASYALGKLGHQVVCQLAFNNLPIDKQQKVAQLLATLSKKDIEQINRYNYQKKGTVITYAKACTWADAIKKEPEYDQYKSWHYLNLPRSDSKVTASTCEENCISRAIEIHNRQLINSENNREKLEALMFLGHWLGDIHQPLHVSYADDYGGNRRAITIPQDKCNNLHWLWDSCLLVAKLAENKQVDKYLQLMSKLSNQWQSAPIQQWQSQNTLTWANESLTLIRTASFKYCKINEQGKCKKLSAKVIHLPKSYLIHYQPILEQRILQAAVRLNGLLATAL